MTMKVTLWAMCLLFIATILNVVSAYSAMGDVNVHDRFQTMGILGAPSSDTISMLSAGTETASIR